MKNFNLKRFAQLLRLDIVQNRKSYLNGAAGLLIGHLALNLATYYSTAKYLLLQCGEEQCGLILAEKMAGSLVFFFYVVMLVSASLMFGNLPTKSKRTYYLMLPATAVEKCLSRAVICFILVPVAFFATYVLADLIRMAVLPMFGMHLCSTIPTTIQCWGEGISDLVTDLLGQGNEYSKPVAAWAVLGMSFFSVTAYVLGSVFFRRRAFILTSLLLLASGIAFGMLLDSTFDTFCGMTQEQHNIVEWTLVVIFWLLGLMNLVLSWRWFKRVQVIPRKWFKK